MEMSLMSFETYGLPKDKYYKLLEKEANFILNCLGAFNEVAVSKKLKLEKFTDKFVWDLFMECVYSADEQARMIQKENNPDEIKARSWDPGPSRDELMDEIKQVKELLTDK